MGVVMTDGGWIKLHTKILDNPTVMKDAAHCAVWIYLLCNAAWKPVDVMFGGERITLKPGQLTTGRKKIADELKISESKVQRVLKCFESEHQIEQRTSNQCRLISILQWDKYQFSEQQVERQVNNNRTTTEQQLNTKEEYKNNRYIDIYIGVPEEIKEAFMDWVAMRKKIHKPVTTKTTVTRALNRLNSLATTTEEKIELIELATERCWQTFYKEKKDEAERHSQSNENGADDDPGYYGWSASGYQKSS